MSPRSNPSPIPVRFDREEWRQEIERLDKRSVARVQAERARREIEAGAATLNWQRCEVEGEAGTSLPGCNKLLLNFIAFGERHPDNPATHNVYERAHKRLHGRYP